jgi:hypothetical protein
VLGRALEVLGRALEVLGRAVEGLARASSSSSSKLMGSSGRTPGCLNEAAAVGLGVRFMTLGSWGPRTAPSWVTGLQVCPTQRSRSDRW